MDLCKHGTWLSGPSVWGARRSILKPLGAQEYAPQILPLPLFSMWILKHSVVKTPLLERPALANCPQYLRWGILYRKETLRQIPVWEEGLSMKACWTGFRQITSGMGEDRKYIALTLIPVTAEKSWQQFIVKMLNFSFDISLFVAVLWNKACWKA